MVAGTAANNSGLAFAPDETLAVAWGDCCINIFFFFVSHINVGGGAQATGRFGQFGLGLRIVQGEERVASSILIGLFGGLFGVSGHRQNHGQPEC